VTYRIEATADGATIYCLKCEGTSNSPQDVKLRRCPKCGFHSVFPAGMGGLLESELLGLRVGLLRADELVVGEDQESE
jgi:hypothetical protein